MTVSEHVQYNLTSLQKEAVMNEHSVQILKQVDDINRDLFGGQSVVTLESYKDMLRTGKIDSRLQSLGLDFQKNGEPRFFLALAMAHGNVCMNRVEGLSYPRLRRDGNVQSQAQIQLIETTGSDIVATQVGYTQTTTVLGIAKMDNKNKPDIEKRNIETKMEIREVQVSPNDITEVNGNSVIVVNSGGTKLNVNLDTLTRDQAIKLTQGQSIKLNVEVPVNTPIVQFVPGGKEMSVNEAFATTASHMLPV